MSEFVSADDFSRGKPYFLVTNKKEFALLKGGVKEKTIKWDKIEAPVLAVASSPNCLHISVKGEESPVFLCLSTVIISRSQDPRSPTAHTTTGYVSQRMDFSSA